MSNPLNSLELEQNCDYALKTCDFAGVTGENCASEFCEGFPATSGTCPQLGLDPQNCCGSSDPASCLNDWVHNGGGATPNVCASVVSIIIECSSADPALFPGGSIYTSGPQATSLAGCMCYDTDGTYDPDMLDGFASECVASGQAAHPTYYTYGSLLNGFCTDNAGPAGAAVSTTAAAASSVGGGAAAATTTTSPATLATSTAPGSTKSASQTSVKTSSAAGVTSSLVLGTSAAVASSKPASTTTTSTSSGVIKNAFKMRTALFLGFSILFSMY